MNTAKSLLQNAADADNSCPNLNRFENMLERFELKSVKDKDPPNWDSEVNWIERST